MKGRYDFFADAEREALSIGFMAIKSEYIIKTIHSFAGEMLLGNRKKSQQVEFECDLFRYQKELNRELEEKLKSIMDSEQSLGPTLANTRSNFSAYMNSLGLPAEITEQYFPTISPMKTPDLVYVYSSHYGGSRIIPREQYLHELDVTFDVE